MSPETQEDASFRSNSFEIINKVEPFETPGSLRCSVKDQLGKMKEPLLNFAMKIPKQEDRIKPYDINAIKPPASKVSSAIRTNKQSQLIATVEEIKENTTEEFTTN